MVQRSLPLSKVADWMTGLWQWMLGRLRLQRTGYINMVTNMLLQFNRCFTTSPSAHVKSVFASAFIGLLVGCLLHAIPATSTFRYINVIALDIAALGAAILTSLFVFRGPATDESSVSTSTSAHDSGVYHNQMRIGATRTNLVCRDASNSMEGANYTVTSFDNSKVSHEITKLLQSALEVQNRFLDLAPWSTTLLLRTLETWSSGDIVVTVASRQTFRASGLQDSWSYSNYDQKCLRITAGFLDQAELEDYRQARSKALAHLFVAPFALKSFI